MTWRARIGRGVGDLLRIVLVASLVLAPAPVQGQSATTANSRSVAGIDSSATRSAVIESAGLRPDRAYYGIHRPITITVDLGPGAADRVKSAPTNGGAESAPREEDRSDQADIVLIDPRAPAEGAAAARRLAEPLAIAAVKPIWAEPTVLGSTGAVLHKVDLADMFPMIWTLERPRVLYAQLRIGGVERGAPLVLQPMMTPEVASRVDRTGTPQWVEPEQRRRTYSGVRVHVAQHVVMDTSVGQMEFALRPDHAPATVQHFLALVRDGFYTDIGVHRIASLTGGAAPDIVQAGDPLANGLGGPGFYADLERSELAHDYGVLSMARTSDPNTIGSQFFICLSREGTRSLDGRYTSIGQLVRGSETLGAIAKSPVGADQKPANPPVIRRMWLVDAPPMSEAPTPLKDPFAPTSER